MWIYECTHKNTNSKNEIPQDLPIAVSCAYPFYFSKTFFSILTHGFSKRHPPQFLNNNYVCIPKYNYYSILLSPHLPIYFVWCSCTTTLLLVLIKKCAYTDIFIQKMALHIHFYFHAWLFIYNTYRSVNNNII